MTIRGSLLHSMDTAREAVDNLIKEIRFQSNAQDDYDLKTHVLLKEIESYLIKASAVLIEAGGEDELQALMEKIQRWLYS